MTLSHNIPIFIDKYQKEKKNNFPAITFNNSITKILNELNNISQDEY